MAATRLGSTFFWSSNTFKPGQLNVWRDRDGHYCAAATIIRTSGQVALADKVAEQNNFIRLADVSQGPLMDWILTSGFTQDEIAAIQAPFQPVADKPTPESGPINLALREKENARLSAIFPSRPRTFSASGSASPSSTTSRSSNGERSSSECDIDAMSAFGSRSPGRYVAMSRRW